MFKVNVGVKGLDPGETSSYSASHQDPNFCKLKSSINMIGQVFVYKYMHIVNTVRIVHTVARTAKDRR